MSKKERSVIERLDDIEKKIPSFNFGFKKPVSISEIIGQPFEEYLKKATLFGFEEDVRKFKKAHKKERTIPIVLLSILFPILVFSVVSFIILQRLEWLLVLASVVAMISPILSLVTLANQKNKQKMPSFWNYRNKNLYVVNKKSGKSLVMEEETGAIAKLLLICRIIAIIACAVSSFGYFVFS